MVVERRKDLNHRGAENTEKRKRVMSEKRDSASQKVIAAVIEMHRKMGWVY
jgi:hypothetical protein